MKEQEREVTRRVNEGFIQIIREIPGFVDTIVSMPVGWWSQ
jgi:hypothetical protein